MEIKRGYVKWTDKEGVFHKEPLWKHKDLLAEASPEQYAIAMEVKALTSEEVEEKQEELLLTIPEEPKKKK